MVALLGLYRGSVALTKIDRIDPAEREARIAQLRTEIADLLAGTPLAGAPLFPVSAQTGEGLEPLRQHLLQAAGEVRGHDDALDFRLATDRA